MSETKTEQKGIFETTTVEDKADTAKTEAKTSVKDTKKKATKKSDKKELKVEEKYKFPFQFAFGPNVLSADVLETKLNFVTDKEYTAQEVKEKLSPAIFELKAPDANVLYLKESNTFVLSNVLQKKGATTINRSSLVRAETQFVYTYYFDKTEERALVYKHIETGEEIVIFPEIRKTPVYLEGSPDLYYNNDLKWPLVADLHSHHVMGGTPSEIDNENEKVRHILFGIAFWDEGKTQVMWRFRRWDGEEYIQRKMVEEVD